MPPGTRRANRAAYAAEHDDFEGLPVRQWREEVVPINAIADFEQATKPNIWDVDLPWGMPTDSHLLPPHSQAILRAARSGTLYKRLLSEDDDGDVDALVDNKPDKKEEDPTADTYLVRTWRQVPRNTEHDSISHLAKRRKGIITLPSKYAATATAAPAGPTVTRAIVRRIDAAGNPYTQEVTLVDGEQVDGEIISTTVVVDPHSGGAGVSPHSTPNRRRPQSYKKKRGPGRGRKKKLLMPENTRPGGDGGSIESDNGGTDTTSIDFRNEDGDYQPPQDDEDDEVDDEGAEGDDAEGDDAELDEGDTMLLAEAAADADHGMTDVPASHSRTRLEGSPLKHIVMPSPTELPPDVSLTASQAPSVPPTEMALQHKEPKETEEGDDDIIMTDVIPDVVESAEETVSASVEKLTPAEQPVDIGPAVTSAEMASQEEGIEARALQKPESVQANVDMEDADAGSAPQRLELDLGKSSDMTSKLQERLQSSVSQEPLALETIPTPTDTAPIETLETRAQTEPPGQTAATYAETETVAEKRNTGAESDSSIAEQASASQARAHSVPRNPDLSETTQPAQSEPEERKINEGDTAANIDAPDAAAAVDEASPTVSLSAKGALPTEQPVPADDSSLTKEPSSKTPAAENEQANDTNLEDETVELQQPLHGLSAPPEDAPQEEDVLSSTTQSSPSQAAPAAEEGQTSPHAPAATTLVPDEHAAPNPSPSPGQNQD